MPNTYIPVGPTPKNLQWWGIGREVTPGTIVAPATTVPVNDGVPSDQANMLMDQSLRGDMGIDYNIIVGTEIAALPLSGDVYLDTIGYMLHNLMGEYMATGTAGTALGSTATTVAAGTTGAVTVTSGAVTAGGFVTISSGSGSTLVTENVAYSSSTATTVTLTGTTRMTHTGTTTFTVATAPFTHTFRLLNAGGTTFGAPANCQPPTHTISYHNALPANATFNPSYTGTRQYAYWCAGSMGFAMDANNLFTHQTQGAAVLGVDATTTVTQAGVSTVPAQPAWRFVTTVGGTPSSGSITGGTIISNIESATVDPVRGLTNKFALANQQAPIIIGRVGISVTGQLSYLAVDESPLLQTLAGTQQPLQIAMTNGLAGANLLSCSFIFSNAQFNSAQLADPDMMQYGIGFHGLNNTNDAGTSGGRAPFQIQIQNAVATY